MDRLNELIAALSTGDDVFGCVRVGGFEETVTQSPIAVIRNNEEMLKIQWEDGDRIMSIPKKEINDIELIKENSWYVVNLNSGAKIDLIIE